MRSQSWSALSLAIVSLVATALALAGCGSAAAPAASSDKPTATVSAKSSPSATADPTAGLLASLSDSAKAGKLATFKAVYTTSGSGKAQNITVEQKPPKSVFIADTTTFINDGSKSYVCSPQGGSTTCFAYGSAAGNPLASMIQIYSADNIITIMQQAQNQVIAKAEGITITFSDETFAGQASKCMNETYQGQTVKYCVTKGGILAYEASGGSSFSLTSYSESVSDADFSLPPGATVQTIPQ